MVQHISKTKQLIAALGIVSLCLFSLIATRRSATNQLHNGSVTTTHIPQCGHWCILRCCEILGVPMSMASITQILPNSTSGHSFLELSKSLQSIGLETEGRRESFQSIGSESFPFISHMKDPNHFIVVSQIDIDNEKVYFYDCFGRRKIQSAQNFKNKWSGNILCVSRDPNAGPLPVYLKDTNRSSPRIQFVTLSIDKGSLSSFDGPVDYLYKFTNLGNSNLFIRNVSTDCQCIKADKPDTPIAPGKTGVIRLRYKHEKNKYGPFIQQSFVESNDPLQPLVKLRSEGNYDIAVRVNPLSLDFGNVVCGDKQTVVCFMNYSGDDEEFTIDHVDCEIEDIHVLHYPLSNLSTNEISPKWWPGSDGKFSSSANTQVLEVIFNPPVDGPGDLSGKFFVHTSISGFEKISIPIKGKAVQSVLAYPSILNFGEVPSDSVVKQTVTLEPMVNKSFRIISIEPNSPILKCIYPSTNIQTSEEIEFQALGAEIVKLSDSKLNVRIRLVESGNEFSLQIPVYAWLREDN